MSALYAPAILRYLALILSAAVFAGTIGSALMGQYRLLFWPITGAAGVHAAGEDD